MTSVTPPPFPEKSAGNTMLNALATATHWHTSLTLLDAIWSPDAFSYNSALSALQGLEARWEWGHNHHMNGDKPPAIAV